MAVCTFFGHRECPEAVKPALERVLEMLIREQGVDLFYVGNQGQFDACARCVLQKLKEKYPHIRYGVVLAYMPGLAGEAADREDTMLPEGIETVHSRYAITWRNNWMLRQAEFVVTYVTHSWGGAYRFARAAEKRGKRVYSLSAEITKECNRKVEIYI